MIDWVVILTPLLALGALLLLGFAGCEFKHGEAVHEVDIVVHVPTTPALTVTQIVFRCQPPGGVQTNTPVPSPSHSTSMGEDVYQHDCGPPAGGSWLVGCQVKVQQNGTTAQAATQATFSLSGPENYVSATF